MARYYKQFPLPMSEEQAKGIIQNFLDLNGFVPYEQKGEPCFKKGSGFLTAPQFLKISLGGGVVVVEAWLRYVLLPGVYFGEMGLTGFYGWAVKKALKSKVDTLEASLGFVPGVTPCLQPGAPVPAAVPAQTPAAAAAQSAMRVCPQCGEQMSAGDEFCGRCGASMNQPEPAQASK